MGSSNSRITSPSPSASPIVNRKKARKLSSLFCGCSSSHAPFEMEDYPDEFLANPSELCDDPLFSEVLKSKEEVCLISSTDAGGLVSSADEAANLSITFDSDPRANLEQDARDYEVINLGDHLLESGELVPPLVSLSGTNGLDRDDNTTASSAWNDELQPSEMVPMPMSPNGIAVNSSGDLGLSRVSEVYAENDDVNSEVGNIENQGAESRAIFCSSGSSTSGEFDFLTLPNSAGGDSSTELIPLRSEFPIFDREQDAEPEGVVELDVVSVSSDPLSSLAADTASQEARRNGRISFRDVFSGHISRANNDSYSSDLTFSAPEDYQASQERWLFGGGRLERPSDWRRRRRFELWDRLHSGLQEHGGQNTSCPLGLHTDGNECLCNQYLTEESNARSSISRIVMLAEALFEVLDEIHRQPMPFSLSMGPIVAPESVVDSLPLKSYENIDPAGSKDGAEQCNICFVEYEEGDKIRVLPCHHEYHMKCVDKWLKEIHGVCPLCRGDVCQGFIETSASSSEVTYS
ncbi:hypothetical protein SAY87_018166 [Trapa incisa]|uniref:RING-type domain-containing protein n=1 Tax=Trapa incisa TaxID=236973 RepID=A0AAN7QSI9_9MYRT|nr:hypothetical protein SAY87_018166 [Trapa incisa]